MAEAKYSWLPGSGRRVPAQTVGQVVAEIEAEHGACHPGQLVEAARPEDSPLHPLFNWDDQHAAEQFRVDQARRVLRTLRVVVEEREKPAPAFMAVQRITSEGVLHGYRSYAKIMASEEDREYVLFDALRSLNGLRERYEEISELEGVWERIREAHEQHAKK